jgi:hypothetical protein
MSGAIVATIAGAAKRREEGGGFSPLDVAGCTLWLDGADAATMYDATSGGSLSADGEEVARWEDKSGAAKHVTQATGAKQPLRDATGLNGLDSLRWPDTTNDLGLYSDSSLEADTIFVVATFPGSTFSSVYEGLFNSKTTFIILGSSGRLEWYPPAVAGTFYTNGVASAAPLPALNSGAVITRKTSSSQSLTSIAVGHERVFPSRGWRGIIAEVIVYDTPLADGDREAVENYLGTKWGITITH